MARETIASVKQQLREVEEANARLISEKIELMRAHADALNKKDDRIGELLRGHAGVLAAKDSRISELFRSNNEYQAEARAARAEIQGLQFSLSDASRVIAALGRRPI